MKTTIIPLALSTLFCLTFAQAQTLSVKNANDVATKPGPNSTITPSISMLGKQVDFRAKQGPQSSNLQMGGVAGGGGNTVGDQLYDDYENQDSILLSAEKIAELAKPLLSDISVRLPGFAFDLSQGIKNLHWYLEPKALKQTGVCRNGNNNGIESTEQQVVRACQTDFDVRIDKLWAEANPEKLAHLIVHELLVYLRLQKFPQQVSESGMFAVSREIRNPVQGNRLSNSQLIDLIHRAGFGKVKYLDITGMRDFYARAGRSLRATPTLNLFAKHILCVKYRNQGGPMSISDEKALCAGIVQMPSDTRLIKQMGTNKSYLAALDKLLPQYGGAIKISSPGFDEGW